MEFLKKLLKKVPGYIFGLIGTISGFLGIGISFLWHNSIEPINFISFWVSNLGAGPFAPLGVPTPYPGSNILFNITIFVCTILIWLFALSIYSTHRKDSEKRNVFALLGFIFASFHAIGMIIISFCDMSANLYPHVVGALVLFNCLIAEIICFTVVFYREGKRWKFQIIIAMLSVIFIILFYVVGYFCWLDFGLTVFEFNFDNLVAFMSSMLPALNPLRIMEWISFPTMFIWIMISAVSVGIDSRKK
jgi:hypothetical protein